MQCLKWEEKHQKMANKNVNDRTLAILQKRRDLKYF